MQKNWALNTFLAEKLELLSTRPCLGTEYRPAKAAGSKPERLEVSIQLVVTGLLLVSFLQSVGIENTY